MRSFNGSPLEMANSDPSSMLRTSETATRAFLQYDSTMGENGHFVLYHEPGAADHARELLRTALAGAASIGKTP